MMYVKVKIDRMPRKWLGNRTKGTINICGYYVPFDCYHDIMDCIVPYNPNSVVQYVANLFAELKWAKSKREIPEPARCRYITWRRI